MKQPKKSLKQTVQEEMPEFCAEVDGLSVDELNNRLAKLAKDGDANDQAKEADEELEKSRSLVSELSAPYRDAKKAIKLRSRYIIAVLDDKGAN